MGRLKIVADENIYGVAEAFAPLGEVCTVPGRSLSASVLADADMLLVRSVTRVDAALLDGTRVRFAATATAGTDHVDVGCLRERGVVFAHAPGSNAAAVADYVALALVHTAHRLGMDLPGRRMGIVGFGEVGSRVASRARALGLRVAANDPPLERETGHCRFRALDEVLRESDIVTLHIPLIREGPGRTARLADEGFFRAMRPGCIFINASRGEVVDEAALLDALDSGRVRAAILDVWDGEPLASPALAARAAIATPHVAGYSVDGKAEGTRMILEAACRFLGLDPRAYPAPRPPDAPTLRLGGEARGPADSADLLDGILRKFHDIEADDRAFRESLALPEKERAAAFDRLRRCYPARREFSACAIECPAASPQMRGLLASLGFCVESLQERHRNISA